jgi:hypothetical protein
VDRARGLTCCYRRHSPAAPPARRPSGSMLVGCRLQWEATSNPPPTAVDEAYNQCMVARGFLLR